MQINPVMQTFKKICCVVLIALGLAGAGLASAQKGGYHQLSQAPAGVYTLDKTHGYITFSYLHQGYSRPWLRFRDIDATLKLSPADLGQSELSVTIAASSIDSGVDEFDAHLRDKKFFHVEKFPRIDFVANEIVASEQQPGEFLVTGSLTIKGISKPLTLRATFNKGGLHFKTRQPVIGFSARANLLRSEWDLGYAVPIVSDEVELVIEVEFHKAKVASGGGK